MYERECARLYACVFLCMCVCVCVYMCECACVHIRMIIYIYSFLPRPTLFSHTHANTADMGWQSLDIVGSLKFEDLFCKRDL